MTAGRITAIVLGIIAIALAVLIPITVALMYRPGGDDGGQDDPVMYYRAKQRLNSNGYRYFDIDRVYQNNTRAQAAPSGLGQVEGSGQVVPMQPGPSRPVDLARWYGSAPAGFTRRITPIRAAVYRKRIDNLPADKRLHLMLVVKEPLDDNSRHLTNMFNVKDHALNQLRHSTWFAVINTESAEYKTSIVGWLPLTHVPAVILQPPVDKSTPEGRRNISRPIFVAYGDHLTDDPDLLADQIQQKINECGPQCEKAFSSAWTQDGNKHDPLPRIRTTSASRGFAAGKQKRSFSMPGIPIALAGMPNLLAQFGRPPQPQPDPPPPNTPLDPLVPDPDPEMPPDDEQPPAEMAYGQSQPTGSESTMVIVVAALVLFAVALMIGTIAALAIAGYRT